MTQAPVISYFRKADLWYDKYLQVHRQRSILLFLVVFLLTQPVCGFVTIEYFHQADCLACMRTDPIIHDIRERYGDRVSVRDIPLDTRDAIRLLISYGRTEIPVVVINHVKVLDGPEITRERLEEEIGLAEAGAYAGNETVPGDRSYSRSRVFCSILLIFPWDYDRTFPLPARQPRHNGCCCGQHRRLSYDQTALCSPLGVGIVTMYLLVAAVVLLAGFRLTTGSGFSTRSI